MNVTIVIPVVSTGNWYAPMFGPSPTPSAPPHRSSREPTPSWWAQPHRLLHRRPQFFAGL